ncbi:cytochrome P450 monooxygenase [Stemphylium lycopersici]|uniref:Cytochrome P450 monooxygenase n=1 Tax=Stemphylium lycopersici TaxID=183478 RepID=A0A364NBQ1_STELY|nr:cytochrome P450 monooxygenase [Stemphylium lycopersici]RAR14758.1 cytochrome P450 monooxygenase [Stemphylium lycopersici]
MAVGAGAFVVFVASLMANRQHVKRLQKSGAPMPKHHSVFGHFLVLKETIQSLPRNTVMHVVVRRIADSFPGGVFYLNLWPFNAPVMVVANPFVASQVEAAFLDKPANICATLEVINGGPSLLTMHGSTWKKWRALFNPGFAAGYITGLSPAISEEVMVFCKLLQDRAAKGEIFTLEEFTLRLTFDIIARVTLGARLHYQTQGSALADCLRRQIYWTQFGTVFNPIRRYLSPRPLVQKYNSYRMNQYLDEEIDKRFEELASSRRSSFGSPRPQSRSIIALAMDKYLDEVEGKDEMSKSAFKQLAKPQLRLFLYAGHDTTSSTLLYSYMLLSRHPDALSKVHAEHDKVFGPDFSLDNITRIITDDPILLNHLPYTLAVIKEVLRMFPPAGSMRDGRPDVVLADERGQQYPTEGCNVWTLSLALHHNPEVFEHPEDFIPDRWLVDSEDRLHPKKASWRPFEWGPRNCIGQTLAQLELKIALVMTVRMFDITPAYEEWDKLHPRKGIKTVDGNRAYQAEMGGGGAHPVDGFPVKITLRP